MATSEPTICSKIIAVILSVSLLIYCLPQGFYHNLSLQEAVLGPIVTIFNPISTMVAQCLADPISIIHVHLSGLTISGSPVKGVVGIMSKYIKQTVLFREVTYDVTDKKLEDKHSKKKMDNLMAKIIQYMLVFYVLVIPPPHC